MQTSEQHYSDEDYRSLHALYVKQHSEIERLRVERSVANDRADRLEREWHLRGDEIERLHTHLRAIRGLAFNQMVRWQGPGRREELTEAERLRAIADEAEQALGE